MRIRVPLALLAVGGALAASASPASASSNAASTQAYLRANYALVQHFAARIPSAEMELNGVLAGVRAECPAAAAGSPEDVDSEQLSNEVIGTMVTSVVQHNLAPILAAIRAVAPLRWSSAALTNSIRAESAKGKVLSTLAIPDLCAEVKAWTASGFQTLPSSTVSFDAQFMPAWVAPGFLPAGLSAYESPEERGLARRTAQLERRWTDFEAREVETWGTIMDTLELWP
jgi:hypothetical protein